MKKKRRIDKRRYPKRFNGRNYNNAIYTKFRQDVKDRDSGSCKWPGCRNARRLQVHHILKWSDYPNLRFVLSNGITLCDMHHKTIRHNEDYYIQFFQKLLGLELLEKIKELV